MSELTLFSDRSSDVLLHTLDRTQIEKELKQRRIGFERWPTQTQLDPGASQEESSRPISTTSNELQRGPTPPLMPFASNRII